MALRTQLQRTKALARMKSLALLALPLVATTAAWAAPPTLSINDVSVKEGDSGTSQAVFTLTLSASAPQGATVRYSTTDGSAKAGSDYIAASGSVDFAPKEMQRTITVVVR